MAWTESIRRAAFTIGGLVAGEGTFSIATLPGTRLDGSRRKRFVFAVQMARRDRPLLEAMAAMLDAGSVADRAPGRTGWQPTSVFSISSLRGHRRATIPFFRLVLPPTAKREQFQRWCQAIDDYSAGQRAGWGEGPSICSCPGCDRPVRGRGLCRGHYYRATGH